MFEGKYTTIGQKWHLHPGVVKKSLNANLGELLTRHVAIYHRLMVFTAALMPAIEDEVVHAYQSLLPTSEGSQSLQIS